MLTVLLAALSAAGCGIVGDAAGPGSHASTNGSASFSASERPSGPVELLDGPAARSRALDLIQHAHTSIDLEMYELGDDDLIDALEAAQRRGVRLRVLLDASEKYSRDALPELQKAGVPVRSVRVPGGIDHVKLLVVDGTHVLMGGINWGPHSWENHDWDLAFPTQAPKALWVHVGDDWQAVAGAAAHPACPPSQCGVRRGTADGPVVFTDSHIGTMVVDAVKEAKSSIDIEADALSDDDLVAALAGAAERGVNVSVVASYQYTSTRAAVKTLLAHGVQVRYYKGRQILHAKVMTVDHHLVVLGSANFSYHGYAKNHELDVRLESPHIAAQLESDEAHLFRSGRAP